jgi:aldehyde dehydrogenase (NAD+)
MPQLWSKSNVVFFNTGKTKDVEFRIQQLKKLRQLIVDNEQVAMDALKKDLNKSPMEAYATEIGFPYCLI